MILVQVVGHRKRAHIKGKHQNSPQLDGKNMPGNIGNLLVKCMQQVIKKTFVRSVGVSDYYAMYNAIGREPSQCCEMSVKVTNCVTDPFQWFCELFVKGFWLEGGKRCGRLPLPVWRLDIYSKLRR